MTADVVVRDTDVVPRRLPRDDAGPDEWAAWRVAYEREKNGWSLGELARRVTEAGAPMQHQAIWQIENRKPPRRISLSEGIAFCKVFGIDLTEFGIPPEEVMDSVLTEVKHELRDWRRQTESLIDLLRGLHIQPVPDAATYQGMLAELRDGIDRVSEATAEVRAKLDADRKDADQ